jgi:serine/threonine protein kinase
MTMKSLLASARSLSGLDRVDSDVRAFEEEWLQHGEVSLEQFWTNCRGRGNQDEADQLALLGALVKADLRCRFELGESPAVAHYLNRFPDLMRADSRVVSLIYEEFCLLEERGKTADVEAFCDRYPAWRDSLVSQLHYHRQLSRAVGLRPPVPDYPEPGGLFEEFRLISMIGQGGSSRVYLAHDLSLGGKRVVLKISPDRGQEPKTQGALDHPHIVPVHSVSFQPDCGLRGLAMPYRPGLPLDEIVKSVRPQRRPRAAKVLWDVLIQGTSPDLIPLSADQCTSRRESGPSCDGWKGFPIRGTYSQGVAWIGLVLARTLSYAHGMQTYHRDVKPGNVLITLDHGPQLLDFNLAESPHSSQRAGSAMLGGTLPYMAPEQIEAFLNPDLWGTVGAGADIYSLGLVLRELLTGQGPDVPDAKLPPARAMRELLDRRAILRTDVRSQNREIPHALEAIVQRCLMLDPQQRYFDTQALADDLECFLSRKPLNHAVNPSRRERVKNWVTRNHRSIVGTSLAIVLGILIGLAAAPITKKYLSAPKPKPETLPAFQEAVRAIDQKQPRRAIELLRGLVQEYPDHPLSNAYLGLALGGSTAQLVEDDAQTFFSRGMSLPDGESTIKDWARNNTAIADHLEQFAKSRLERLGLYDSQRNLALKLRGPVSEDPQSQDAKRRYYEAALKALRLALGVQPGSEKIRTEMADAEDFLGDYASAYQHLTEVINAIRSRGDPKDSFELLVATAQRARVAIRWAGELRKGGDPAKRLSALEMLKGSASGLASCRVIAREILARPNTLPVFSDAVFQHLWLTGETWLVLGEFEQEQRQLTSSWIAFTNAKRALDEVDKFATSRAIQLPTRFDDLRKRLRVGLRDTKPSQNRPN